MSTTMIICLIIIGICTIVLISSTVYAKILDRQVKLTMKKNNEIHLLDFGPPSADETQKEIPVMKYEKWLPYCQDAFGFTKSFKCSKCDCVTEMPVLSDHSISYYAYCPHCGSAMLHRVDE